MYRPDGLQKWMDDTHDTVEKLGPLPPQTEFPILVPDGFYWRLLRRQIFEAGADAILESLEPLIRKMAPSSKLIDIIYGEK